MKEEEEGREKSKIQVGQGPPSSKSNLACDIFLLSLCMRNTISNTIPPTSSTRAGKAGWRKESYCSVWWRWRFKFTWIHKKKHKSGGDAIYDHHLHQQFDFVKGFCRSIKYKMQASGSSWVSVSGLTILLYVFLSSFSSFYVCFDGISKVVFYFQHRSKVYIV